MTRTIEIREDITPDGGRLAVEGNLVKNVKVLGLESRNGRRYLFEAIKEAVPAYEGLRINLNHPQRPTDPRQFNDRFGWLENVRAVDGDGMRADLRFNPKHPEADSFAWWAANKPSMIGLSHNAVGSGHSESGVFVVDKIVRARSVDVVSDPATTRGLMESEQQGKPMKLKAFLSTAAAKFSDADKPGVKALVKQLSEDYGDADALVGGDEAEGMSPEEHLKAGVKNACLAILDDDSMDAKEKVKKLKAYIMAHAKLADDESDEEDEEEEEGESGESAGKKKDDDDMGEAIKDLADKNPAVKQLVEQLDSLKAKDARNVRKAKGRKLCEQLRLPEKLVTEVFLEQLADQPSEAGMRSLIEDRRAVAGVGRPKSAGPDAGSARMDAKEFARALKR